MASLFGGEGGGGHLPGHEEPDSVNILRYAGQVWQRPGQSSGHGVPATATQAQSGEGRRGAASTERDEIRHSRPEREKRPAKVRPVISMHDSSWGLK